MATISIAGESAEVDEDAFETTGTSPPAGHGGSALMTAGEVAELLRVSTEWVWEQSRKGTIPTVKLGRNVRYRPDAIMDWVAGIEAGDGAVGWR